MATRPFDSPMGFGEFVLDPANEQLVGPNGPIHIGHKAYCVLEALIGRCGRLLTKKALFETVWDGTIVSESALTSVIKELRRALGDESRNPRFIESVYGRGYRFLVPATEIESLPPAGPAAAIAAAVTSPASDDRWSRRGLLAVAGIGALGVFGGAMKIHLADPPTVPPEVDQLVFRARQAMDQFTVASEYQAIGLLRRVVALAPDYADGWGLLGKAYGIPSHYRERSEGLMLRARAEAAAHRALKIDPGNSYGELALGIALPFVGPYLERERHFERAIAARPDSDDALPCYAAVLQYVGRPAEAVSVYGRIRQRPLKPAVYRDYIMALWSAGRLEELDRALDDAADLYPTHDSIWSARLAISVFSGRAAAAIAQAQSAIGLPAGLDPGTLQGLMGMARAVEDPDSPQAATLVDSQVRKAREYADGAESAIRLLSALGRVDQAFTVAHAYYFNRGFTVPDTPTPGSGSSPEQRQTRILFEPETQKMRADPRFETLVRDLGLDDYWRRSGAQPDYRRDVA